MDRLYCISLIYLSLLFIIESEFAESAKSGFHEILDRNNDEAKNHLNDNENEIFSGNGLDEGASKDTSQMVDQDYPVLEPERGSADFDLTPCQSLLIARQELGNLVGLHVPQCTPEGKFVPRQCDVRAGVCWCVDIQGRKLAKTTHRGSNKLNCSPTGWKHGDIDSPETPITDEDFYGIANDRKNNQPSGTVTSIGVDIESFNGDEDLAEYEEDQNHGVPISQSSLHHPVVWAAIISGTIIILLCLVLVAMCIVHRLRMKNEGSYALCEDKKHKFPPFGKGPRRESIVYTRSQANDECFT